MYVLVMSRLQKRHNNCILKQIVNVWKYTIWKEIWICFFNWKIAVYYVYYIWLFFHENASLFNKWPSIYIIRVLLCPFVRPSVRPFVRPSIWPSIRLSALNLLSEAYILFIPRPILLILYPQSAFCRVYSNLEPFWRSKLKVIAELYKKEKPCLEHILSLLNPI